MTGKQEKSQEKPAKYIIVAFRVDSENSIYYKKCADIEDLKGKLWYAFEKKDADFVSIRKIKRGDSG